MKLTLSNPLTYRSSDHGYDSAVKAVYHADTGTDAVLLYNYEIRDESVYLSLSGAGMKTPLSDKEKKVIESGLTPLVREEEDFFIPAGTYSFSQMAPVEAKSDLPLLIYADCTKDKGKVYIRLFKENAFETVMQFLFPED
jgi:hypothetical protein